MKQVCKVCKYAGWDTELRIPRCTKGMVDWADMFGLNSAQPGAIYDIVPELRTGEVVEVGSKFFRVIPDTGAEDKPSFSVASMAAGDELERQADALLGGEVMGSLFDDPRIVRFATLTDHQQSVAMSEALTPWAVRENDELDDEAEQMVIENTLIASRGNRFGFKYQFLGKSVREAFIEPEMWEFGCEKGVHKWLNQPFTSFYARSQKHVFGSNVAERLAKVLWAEKELRNADAPVHVCLECGAPVSAERSEAAGQDLCLWCVDVDGSMVRNHFVEAAKNIMSQTKQAHDLEACITVEEVAYAFGSALPLALMHFSSVDKTKLVRNTASRFLAKQAEEAAAAEPAVECNVAAVL